MNLTAEATTYYNLDCGAWWLIDRFVAFRPKGHGFNPAVAAMQGDLGQVLHSDDCSASAC